MDGRSIGLRGVRGRLGSRPQSEVVNDLGISVGLFDGEQIGWMDDIALVFEEILQEYEVWRIEDRVEIWISHDKNEGDGGRSCLGNFISRDI